MPKGYFMNTIGGRKFYPMDPQIEDLNLDDIVHSLSLTCRFGGHVPDLYSVGQHSVILAHLVPKEHTHWALMHDAAEAYMNDLVVAVKMELEAYRSAEKRILRLIAKRYKLPSLLPPLEVKVWDDALCWHEADAFGMDKSDWVQRFAVLPKVTIDIQIWRPEQTREVFHDCLKALKIEEPTSEEQDE